MRFARLGLKTKVAIGFGSLLAIIACMGVVSCRSTVVSQQLADHMRIYSAMKDHGREMEEAFLTERIGARDVLMGRDHESTHLFEHGETDFRKAMEELDPLLTTQRDHELLLRSRMPQPTMPHLMSGWSRCIVPEMPTARSPCSRRIRGWLFLRRSGMR
jgi:hypothetical protein